MGRWDAMDRLAAMDGMDARDTVVMNMDAMDTDTMDEIDATDVIDTTNGMDEMHTGAMDRGTIDTDAPEGMDATTGDHAAVSVSVAVATA